MYKEKRCIVAEQHGGACTGTGKSVKNYPLAYFILFLLSFPVKKKIWEASGRVLVAQAVNRVWRAHRRHDDGRKRVGQ